MAYRVKYQVEKGTRVRTDVVTGAKVKNSYTIKKPQTGQYSLRNAYYSKQKNSCNLAVFLFGYEYP